MTQVIERPRIQDVAAKDGPAPAFGSELQLDLYECDPATIRSAEKLDEFIRKLCRRIKMERYGEPIIAHFGHKSPVTSGYSLVQLIETSCISGHFSEGRNNAYLNLFSCKAFDVADAAAFCKKFFKARRTRKRFTVRR